MRRTTSSGSEGDRIYRPSAGIAMQNRTGPGGGGYSSSSSNYYTESPSQQRQSPSQQRQDHMLLPDRGYERKSLELMERLLDVSIESQNMLREYLERGVGDNRGQWAEDPSGDTDAREDGGVATTAATQVSVNALMPDHFRSASNKAALNFDVASDKAPLQLHKFARIVADTWLGDYKTGHETDPTDANIYTRKVSTLAMMVSNSLTKIGYPSEHVSAAKVSVLIKRFVKQARWRMKHDRDVKSGGGKSDATNGTRSESSTPFGSISQLVDDDGYDDSGQLRAKSSPQSRVYHDGISNDEDEDYRAEDSILSGPSNSDSEEVPWSKRKSAYLFCPCC
jgi:hypothetical protein